MKKIIKPLFSILLAMLILTASFSAFANVDYIKSSSSKKEDIAIASDENYEVAGKDITQDKYSAYTTDDFSDKEVYVNNVGFYGTIAEGTDVYDPVNPAADENGYVDGTILVGLPTTIEMNGTPDDEGYYTAEVTGKVKGNIAGSTVINVIPDSEFKMSSEGQDDIIVNVEQDNTKFANVYNKSTEEGLIKSITPEFNNNATFNVLLKAKDGVKPGEWEGTLNYRVSLTQNEQEVKDNA